MKHILITTALFLTFNVVAQSQTADLSANGQMLNLEAEDQFGAPVQIPGEVEKPYLIFFLPETDSDRSQQALEQVETSFQKLDELHGDQTGQLFVVEPFRSGRFVNYMMGRRLRNKDFRVTTDDNGKIMETLSPESDDLFFRIVAPDGEIVFRSSIPFTGRDWDEGLNWLKEKLTD